MHDPASIDRKHQEDIEDAEGVSGYGKEVDAGKRPGVVGEQCPPGLRGRLVLAGHEPGHGTLRDVDAKLEQLAVDAWCAPSEVLGRHSADQVMDALGCRRAPWALAARLVTPEEAKALRCQRTTVSGRTMTSTSAQ